MVKCWLCGIQIDKSTAAGMRGGNLVGVCKPCNRVYSLVRALKSLTKEELDIKITQLKRRDTVHRIVRDNKDMKVSPLTKKILKEIGNGKVT